MPEIILKNLTKIYSGDVLAVEGINLKINDGEFIVFLGPSGCGKSTTLRMIAGLETISEGEILIDNKIVNDIDSAKRDLAIVFQNYALYPHMSIMGNLSFGLKLRKLYQLTLILMVLLFCLMTARSTWFGRAAQLLMSLVLVGFSMLVSLEDLKKWLKSILQGFCVIFSRIMFLLTFIVILVCGILMVFTRLSYAYVETLKSH